MISVRDVVTMRLPFPDYESQLAKESHMYICLEEGFSKLMVKCQRLKPNNIANGTPPYRRITEYPNALRNPFKAPTLIDCDKSFRVESVVIDESLLATIRRNISQEVHAAVLNELSGDTCPEESISEQDICSLNRKITMIS